VENPSEGIDTVISDSTYTLGANLENAQLTSATGAGDLTGNAGDNFLVGNGFINVLDGGAGNDIMQGGEGSDTYYVDSAGDVVIETATAWIDLVFSSVSFTLGAGVDNLTLIGGASVNATGNSLPNALLGNSGDNILSGGGG